MKFFCAYLATAVIAGLSVTSGAELIRGSGREREGKILEILGDKGRLRGPSRKLMIEPVEKLRGISVLERSSQDDAESLLALLESLLEDLDSSFFDEIFSEESVNESRRLRRFRDEAQDEEDDEEDDEENKDKEVDSDDDSFMLKGIFEDRLSDIQDIEVLNKIKERLGDLLSLGEIDLDVFEKLQGKLGNLTGKLGSLLDGDVLKLKELGVFDKLETLLKTLNEKLSFDLNLKDNVVVRKTKEMVDKLLDASIFDFDRNDRVNKSRKLRQIIGSTVEDGAEDLKEEISEIFGSLLDLKLGNNTIFDELKTIDDIIPIVKEGGILSRTTEGLPNLGLKDKVENGGLPEFSKIFGGKGLDGIPTFFKGETNEVQSRRLLSGSILDGDLDVLNRPIFDGDREIIDRDILGGRILDGDRDLLGRPIFVGRLGDRLGERDGIISKILDDGIIRKDRKGRKDRKLVAYNGGNGLLSKIRDSEIGSAGDNWTKRERNMFESKNGDNLLGRLRERDNTRKLRERSNDRSNLSKGERFDKLGDILKGIKDRNDRDSERSRKLFGVPNIRETITDVLDDIPTFGGIFDGKLADNIVGDKSGIIGDIVGDKTKGKDGILSDRDVFSKIRKLAARDNDRDLLERISEKLDREDRFERDSRDKKFGQNRREMPGMRKLSIRSSDLSRLPVGTQDSIRERLSGKFRRDTE